ncbi:unnamed protein product [Taenia asiatica]|uniref:ANK_REP_REGION domain-containing protein n=1 Tax=Taenia asiatica TaxID=60517 RepID=A0A0R3W299_TAEAS|nr:unnamed protein product [Taenia asiatica]
MKAIDVAELYPPFPYISVPDFHTVKIDWYECLEELEEQGMNVAMEVTLKPVGSKTWDRIYFKKMCCTSRGKGSYCIYEDLQGSTEYEMRLRFKCDDNYGPYGNSEVFETPSEPVTAFDLHKAIKFEDIDALNAMLTESNAKIEFTDQMDYTPLMAAVSRNNKAIIRILLSYGANVNTANKLGRTALMLASNKGYIDIVDILIKKGASVNARDIHGMTALFYAVDGEFSNVVRALVRAGADVNHCESDNGYTPLIRLACLANNGNPKVGDTLIECGAKVNQQDKFGQTALIHCAFHRNHADLAKVLLQHGADLSIRNNKKNTAADIAKSLDNTVSLVYIGAFI